MVAESLFGVLIPCKKVLLFADAGDFLLRYCKANHAGLWLAEVGTRDLGFALAHNSGPRSEAGAIRCDFAASLAMLSGLSLSPLSWPNRRGRTASPDISKLGSEVFDDSRWLVDSLQLDIEDIVTAPLHLGAPQSPLRSRTFYLGLGLAGAVWGGSLGLDNTIKTEQGQLAHNALDIMESLSYTMLITAVPGDGAALLIGRARKIHTDRQ